MKTPLLRAETARRWSGRWFSRVCGKQQENCYHIEVVQKHVLKVPQSKLTLPGPPPAASAPTAFSLPRRGGGGGGGGTKPIGAAKYIYALVSISSRSREVALARGCPGLTTSFNPAEFVHPGASVMSKLNKACGRHTSNDVCATGEKV